jgi:hypothetical protein
MSKTPMFQARHYEAIAGVLKYNLNDAIGGDQREGVLSVIRHTANMFRDDNPRFQRDRFLKACGIEG